MDYKDQAVRHAIEHGTAGDVDVIGEGYEPDAKPVFCGYDERCDPDHPFYEDYLVDSYVDPNIRE